MRCFQLGECFHVFFEEFVISSLLCGLQAVGVGLKNVDILLLI